MSHDAQFADHKDCPYHKSTRDENALQAAAESVADRHWRTCSPEFVEWLMEQELGSDLARMVIDLCGEAHRTQIAVGMALAIKENWRSFVANATDYDSWPMARNIAREVRDA